MSITPEVISKKVCRDIVEALGKSHLAEHQLSYDGNKNIYTAGPLPFESHELVIKLPDKRWRSLCLKIACSEVILLLLSFDTCF